MTIEQYTELKDHTLENWDIMPKWVQDWSRKRLSEILSKIEEKK